jgi:hypothetical protein
MPELSVIRWRDIPAQVVARGPDDSARALLPDRFQEAIDAAAMVSGLTDSDDYMTNFVTDTRPCDDDLQAEVDAEVGRLLAEWDDATLKAAIRAGGLRVGS